MNTKKLVYVYEIRHTFGTCVYEMKWNDLVTIAQDKCLDEDDDTYNDDELIVEAYLSRNNRAFGVYETAVELAENVAWYYHHGLHNAVELHKSFKHYYSNDPSMLEWLETFEHEIKERNSK